MKISATELKNRLGRYLDAAEHEPVFIEKSGRKKSVLLCDSHYQALMEKLAAEIEEANRSSHQ
ncbi:MAG: type II toxin-antitoxin system prevent-host-death family antitoxin [Pseudomonadota bacterium]